MGLVHVGTVVRGVRLFPCGDGAGACWHDGETNPPAGDEGRMSKSCSFSAGMSSIDGSLSSISFNLASSLCASSGVCSAAGVLSKYLSTFLTTQSRSARALLWSLSRPPPPTPPPPAPPSAPPPLALADLDFSLASFQFCCFFFS